MKTITFTLVILMELGAWCQFLEGGEQRFKGDLFNEDSESRIMRQMHNVVSELKNTMTKGTDELKAEFKRESDKMRFAISSLLTRLDRIDAECKETRDSLAIKYDLLDRKIFEGFRIIKGNGSVSKAFNDRNLGISECGNESAIITRRISELPHDKEWIVIQKRGTLLKSGKTRQDFNRPWIDYEAGFGDYDADFWIGLDKMHQLTTAGYTQLRIDLEDWEGRTAFAQYNIFRISPRNDSYRLTVEGYTGTAGDSLSPHTQHQFSTADMDNDTDTGTSCASAFGPWWHINSCGWSVLNNVYQNGSKVSNWRGLIWYHWKMTNGYSLKKTTMKIRRPTMEILLPDECLQTGNDDFT